MLKFRFIFYELHKKMWPSPSSWAAASDSELSSDVHRSGNQNKSTELLNEIDYEL